ncbi:MAG: hypothetical protein ABIH17_10855 [Pseudomonadota bacterium]|uniref:hypothetical protein n=1 Tax=Hyphomonas sp. BRH_c22 TaxID=1629710 RepID=UPI000A6B346E|nr:hypothetical protein [Hyphomonas sp. BRH_c22]
MSQMTSHTKPLVPLMPLFDRGVAFAARTDLRQTRMIGFSAFDLDSVTNGLLGLLNGMPTVRHICGVTDEGLAVLERAGLHVDEDMRIFETAAEAKRRTKELIEEGYKLASPYPLPVGTYPQKAQLVSRDLWRRLNNKKNLPDIVPAKHLSDRRIVPLDDPAAFTFNGPVFLKSCTDEATGIGYAVRHCTTEAEYLAAFESLKALGDASDVIVENDMDVVSCWCVSLVLSETGIHYAGAAEQLFDLPGQQSGSVINPSNPFPKAAISLALEVGEAALAMGFRGVAGLDIGLTTRGRLIVFDPNFRIQGSTAQVMLHASATKRSGLPASRSANFRSSLNIRQLALELSGPIDDGWYMPFRLIDGARHAEPPANTTCTGIVMGKTQADAERRHGQLKKLLVAA